MDDEKECAYGDRECQDVARFQTKFGFITMTAPAHLTRRKLAERANFMLEELMEFAEAAGLEFQSHVKFENGEPKNIPIFAVIGDADQDLADQADALIDLVYVAKGTAVSLGLPWRKLWDDVQRANMEKVPGRTKRGVFADVTKPEGWVGPKTDDILFDSRYFRPAWINGKGVVTDAACLDDAPYKDQLDLPL